MTPLAPHRLIALGLFRSSVFFVFAVAAFMEKTPQTQSILIAMVFLLDVISWHLCQVVTVAAEAGYNKGWFNTLSDRIFLENLFDRVRDGSGSRLDIETLRRESAKDAVEDINKFLRENTVWSEWGWLKKALLGVGHFAWYWISYGVFYGAAAVLGSALKSSY